MKIEKDFFGLVALTEENIIIEEIQGLQFRYDVNEEFLRFVSEESNAFNDLTMS